MITIRRAEERDVKDIGIMLYQVHKVHSDARPDIFEAGKRKYSDEEVRTLIGEKTSPVFVATEGEKVVGHVFCKIKQNGKVKSLYIDDLCVLDTERGKGIGRALCNYAEKYAKEEGAYNITLNVWADNESAVRFYTGIGMKVQKIGMEKILK